MSDVNIKQVEGGEVTTLADADGVEIDTGTSSVWIKITNLVQEILKRINSLTAKTTLVDADNFGITDSAASHAAKKITWQNIMAQAAAYTQTLTNKTLTTPTIGDFTNAQHAHSGASSGGAISATPVDGWVAGTGTWSYSSADSPTFVISINADVTALIGVGDRIKLTQTTVKYFIVTAVGAFGGGATLVTVYGGTDYTLANAAITSPYYSHVKAPFGFPLSPAKWTVEVTDTSNRTQASPTQNTWYNLGSITISIPIGTWNVSLKGMIECDKNGTDANVYSTLSTANNSESDPDLTVAALNVGATSTDFRVLSTQTTNKILVLASKTSYYLNEKAGTASAAAIYLRGDLIKTIIRAVCALL